MRVYAVFEFKDGFYSQATLCRLFSTKEAADRYAAIQSDIAIVEHQNGLTGVQYDYFVEPWHVAAE